MSFPPGASFSDGKSDNGKHDAAQHYFRFGPKNATFERYSRILRDVCLQEEPDETVRLCHTLSDPLIDDAAGSGAGQYSTYTDLDTDHCKKLSTGDEPGGGIV
jgi:hypothetical protein